jgi:hypothetical protein
MGIAGGEDFGLRGMIFGIRAVAAGSLDASIKASRART